MEDSHPTDERYDVSDPSVLLEDTWAEEDAAGVCGHCGAPLVAGQYRCQVCRTPVPVCIGSCGACVQRRCVGNRSRS